MSTRITDEIAGWVGEALDARTDEPNSRYDVDMVPLPTGPQQTMPGTVITISIKHIVLGQMLTGQAAMPTIAPTREQVEQVVNQTVNQLQEARSKDAAQANGHGSGDNVLHMP